MKKLYASFSLFTFFAVSAAAQPTLTGANINPTVGESFLVHTIPYTAPGNAGANVTWNFSSVASTGTTTLGYVSPSSTPFGSNFPNATVALSVGSGAYDYYSGTSTAYSREGSSNSSTYIPYSDPEKLLSYPVTFNSTSTDNLYSSYTSNSIPLTRSGTTTSTADGYGTLILPYGTLTDVMRVKIVQDYQDYYQSTQFYDYQVTIYVWYKAGIHYPVFSLTSMSVNGGAPTEYGSYLDASAVGVGLNESAIAQSLTVFPNPSSDLVNVNLNLASSSDLNISVINMLGEAVIISATEKTSGIVNKSIDVSALPAGIYLIQLQAGESTITRKITVQ